MLLNNFPKIGGLIYVSGHLADWSFGRNFLRKFNFRGIFQSGNAKIGGDCARKGQRRGKEGPKNGQRRAKEGPKKRIFAPCIFAPSIVAPVPARPRLGPGSAPARLRPRFASSLFAPSIFGVKNGQRGRRIRKTHGRGAPKKEGERFCPLFFSRAPLRVSLIVANPSGLVFFA